MDITYKKSNCDKVAIMIMMERKVRKKVVDV
jgi:hypothetical protein